MKKTNLILIFIVLIISISIISGKTKDSNEKIKTVQTEKTTTNDSVNSIFTLDEEKEIDDIPFDTKKIFDKYFKKIINF